MLAIYYLGILLYIKYYVKAVFDSFMVIKLTFMTTSPSGRQFESCKDISVYLLSILGEDNMHTSVHTNNNNCDDSVLKVSSGHVSCYLQ